MSDKLNIRTPHAAILVWNYVDRINAENGTDDLNDVEPVIISTVSCISIETSKSKGNPVGSFRLVLAPFKNWVSALTSGSWCAILMSNKPITQSSLRKADMDQVKMIGKIESVRVDTKQVGDTRQTLYYVTGSDWGHIFNNVLYIDNLIASKDDPLMQGNSGAVAIRNAMFGDDNSPQFFAVKDLLNSLLRVFGTNLTGFTDAGDDINRLAKTSYDVEMPQAMTNYFKFLDPSGSTSRSTIITKFLNVKTGKLDADNEYEDTDESFGFIDPFSLQGTNTFWQILLENSNPALNEMYNEINWTDDGPELTLYNRIKPFSFKNGGDSSADDIRSFFYNVRTHKLDDSLVTSVNAGTNWRDKYNFIEIKPQFQDFNIIANWSKQKVQERDEDAFGREGFRPMIVGTKQLPVDSGSQSVTFDDLEGWVKLMREWYFDTHRLLNGTLVMRGTSEYIAVGNNIRFSAGLLNPTPNINSSSNSKKKNKYILAHVENVSHSFTIQDDVRTYVTTIQFVRGIVVNQNNTLVGEGALDTFADDLSPKDLRNPVNNITTSMPDDPDKKVKGT